MPLRAKFADISNLDDLHNRIYKDLLFLAEMQDISRDSLASRVNRINMFIQTTFAYHDVSGDSTITNASTYPSSPKRISDRIGLACIVKVGENGSLTGEFQYDSEIFAHDVILSASSALVRVLDNWSNQKALPIDDINFTKVTAHIPPVTQLDPADASIGTLLISQALRFSKHQAVYDGTAGAFYTYEELFSRARQIQNSVRPFRQSNGVVLLLLERNVDVLAAEIGVSLAGLAWTPCDISQPLPRICDIAADASPVCVVAHQRALNRLNVTEDTFSAPVLLADTIFEAAAVVTSEYEVDSVGDLA